MKISNTELVDLYDALRQLSNEKVSLKLAYATAKNIKKLTNDYESITQQIQKKRQEIINQYVDRDENGNLRILNNEYQFATPQHRREFDEKMGFFKKEVDELLETQVDVDVFMVDYGQLPDQIEPRILMALFPIINNDQVN